MIFMSNSKVLSITNYIFKIPFVRFVRPVLHLPRPDIVTGVIAIVLSVCGTKVIGR